MTQDEIIDKDFVLKMARQAGFIVGEPWREILIERFAKLVADAEREACAKEAESTFYSVQAAENIRARGKA